MSPIVRLARLLAVLGALCWHVQADASPGKALVVLVVIDDDEAQSVVPLVRDEVTIGRAEGNALRLTARDVSPRHARLLHAGDRFFLEDLQSDNGTRVNGVKIHGRVAIDEQSLVEIGGYRLFLTTRGGSAPPRAATYVRPSRLATSSLPRRPPALQQSLKVRYAARTDKLPMSAFNSDYFLVDNDHALFVVTDGPRDERGTKATKAAAEAIQTFYKQTVDEDATWPYPMDRRLDYPENRLLCGVRVAHEKLGRSTSSGLVSAVVNGASLVIAQVGRTPLYRIRWGAIERLTPTATARDEIHVRSHRLVVGDVIVLGSAGLAAALDEKTILAIVTQAGEDLEAAAERLTDAALGRAAAENVTVELLSFGDSSVR